MNVISNLLRGIVIGVANIIPGVSGGTMALVMGIYERLINAIQNISISTLWAFLGLFRFRRESMTRFREELEKIDFWFLAVIMTGALIAIVLLANIMTMLLEQWHDPTYGFFLGLVLMSAYAPYKLIRRKNTAVIVSGLIAMCLVLAVSVAGSGEAMVEKAKAKQALELNHASTVISSSREKIVDTAAHYAYIFILGAAAISAMILPGVSGSFLLLLLGGYFDILRAVATRDMPVIFFFALGCLLGIIMFTRLLNYLLKRWHNETMSFLLGLVVGSLWIIWPFKHSVLVGSEVVYTSNMLPQQMGLNVFLTIGTTVLGMAIVAVLFWIESRGAMSEINGTA